MTLKRFLALALFGGLLALAALALLSRTASAQELGLIVGSAEAAVGDEVSVDLEARDMPAPGLGAWTINVLYDTDVLAAVSCTEQTSVSVCNAEFADGTIRVAGASIDALEGTIGLTNMVFECVGAGDGELTIEAQILVDQTVGDPQPIDAATESGTITCTEAAAPTPTPTPAPTGVLPPSGTGGEIEVGAVVLWLTAVLAGFGSACILYFALSRLRVRD